MNDICDIDERLRQSLRILRAWRWMANLTANPTEVVQILHAEARDLVDMGRQFPSRAYQIGKLIHAYQLLIQRVGAMRPRTEAA